MTTLQEFRDYPRNLMELDAEDLPDNVVDVFIRQAYNRIIGKAKRLPYFQDVKTVTVPANTATVFTNPMRKISECVSKDGVLTWIDQASTLDRFGTGNLVGATIQTTTGTVKYWSQWGPNLQFWPTPIVSTPVIVYGYRQPDYGWLTSPSGSPDLPIELHDPMTDYVLFKVYGQQDDPQMGAFHEQAFEQGVETILPDLLEPNYSTVDLTMGGHRDYRKQLHGKHAHFGRVRFPWEANL